MATIYLISDSHFGHENILNFKRADGTYLRPFESMHEMHECMLDMWNQTVRPGDHVYHLGDFAMKREWLPIARWLHGKKRLVRGNHDIFDLKFYRDAGFQEVYGVRVFADMILSHIPLHPSSLKERWKYNVHGHLHNNESDIPYTASLGPRYFNVSTEVLGHKPISLEEVRAWA